MNNVPQVTPADVPAGAAHSRTGAARSAPGAVPELTCIFRAVGAKKALYVNKEPFLRGREPGRTPKAPKA